MDLISLEVKLACREPGCPVCYLRLRSERRYLYNFLWENVNDAGIRGKLIRSWGFCHTHAWQIQEMEETIWHDGMGTAIVYEDLARRVLRELVTIRQEQARAHRDSPFRRQVSERGADLLRRLAPTGNHRGPPSPTVLAPQGDCRVCEVGEQAVERFTTWLVRDCTTVEDIHQAYIQSDGLCLPHLRAALEISARTNPPAGDLLLDVAIARMEALATNLAEYVRKHSHHYRPELISEPEQEAWIQAIAWFVGERRPEERVLRSQQAEGTEDPETLKLEEAPHGADAV
jgi:hypothetical protein